VIEFRAVTEDESRQMQIQWELNSQQQAERDRLLAECVATHGGHSWELHLYDPEDDVCVALSCEHCPADTVDLYPDGTEMLYVELDDGVQVEAGRHNSPVALIAPVTVEVWSSKTWTDYGWDYDAGLDVEPRGPARSMFPDGGE
jgi:hypothetical protein